MRTWPTTGLNVTERPRDCPPPQFHDSPTISDNAEPAKVAVTPVEYVATAASVGDQASWNSAEPRTMSLTVSVTLELWQVAVADTETGPLIVKVPVAS